jgi:hypothetical protein
VNLCQFQLKLISGVTMFGDYKKYEAWVKVQRGAPIRILGCDRGSEFMSREFTNHLENSGTV